MLKKFLKDVVVFVVGKQAEEIADLLNSNKHVNEFLIAKKLDITINQTRNILYKISNHGLVSSIRKKDKRKGWYTYFWKIEVLKSLEFLKAVFVKRIEQINNQIRSREMKQFYVCEKCCVEFNEENALLHDFTCSECGNVFVVKDSASILKELKKNLNRLSKELIVINEEVKKEKEKLEKKKAKEIKKKISMKKIAKKKVSKKKKVLKKKVVKKTIKKKFVKKKLIKKIVKKKFVKKKPEKKIVKKKTLKSKSKFKFKKKKKRR